MLRGEILWMKNLPTAKRSNIQTPRLSSGAGKAKAIGPTAGGGYMLA